MTPDQVRQVMVEELGNLAPETDAATIDPDADLRESLDLDSMDFLNLIAALHQRLSVAVPEADYAQLRTLNSAIAYFSKVSS